MFPLRGKQEYPLLSSLRDVTSLLFPCLSSAAHIRSVLHPGTKQGPQIPISENEGLFVTVLKQTLADLFSSAGVFFFSVVFAAPFIIFPFILSPAKPSKEGLQFIFCYTDPDPAWFFVAYGHWGYSLSFTSVSSFITLNFFWYQNLYNTSLCRHLFCPNSDFLSTFFPLTTLDVHNVPVQSLYHHQRVQLQGGEISTCALIFICYLLAIY